MKRVINFQGKPCNGLVYEICKLNDTAGFYVCDENPIYAQKAFGSSDCKYPIETDSLRLQMGVNLRIVNEDVEAESETFNIIRLVKYDNEKQLEAFVDLCAMHASKDSSLTFNEFFYSLNELFQPISSQKQKNAVGLYGELALIDYACLLTPSFDISKYWQISGTSTKYDFAFAQGNIEVKTSSTQKLSTIIKHEQLFNNDNNYLAFVSLEESPSGKTLSQLVKKLRANEKCFRDLHSQVTLASQLLRVNENNVHTPYVVREIRCYDASSINYFENVNDRISQLSYNLDLSGVEYKTPDKILNCLLGE